MRRRRPGPRRTRAASVASGDSARARARWWAMSSAARSSAWVEDAAGRGRAGRRPRRPRASSRVRGSASAGRDRRSASARVSRSTSWRTSDAEPVAGPGRRRAAPRPCRGRPAWRRRSASRRGRRRPGRAAGCPARGRSRTRPACGCRPPPGSAPRRRTAAGPRPSRRRGRPRSRRRRGSRSSRSSASITSVAARVPCMAAYAVSKATAGQRRRAFSTTSRSAAELGRGDQADAAGQERQRPLQLGGEQPLGGEQLAAALEPGEQLAEADHPDLAGGQGERAAVGVVVGLGVDHDAGALDQRRVEAVEEGARRRSPGPRCRPRSRAWS